MCTYFCAVDSGHLQAEISDDGWSFVYCLTGKAWKGKISNDDIASSASDLYQNLTQYSETAIKVFSNENCEDIVIDLIDCENDKKELCWKKITSTSVKYSLGSVILERCDSAEVDKVLNQAFGAITKLKRELKESQNEKSKIESEKNDLACRLEDFSRLKVELEGELFTKFVLILNEKKSKIRDLKKEIEKLKNPKIQFPSNTVNNNGDGISKEVLVQKGLQSKKLRSETKRNISHDNSLTEESEELIKKIPRRERKQQQIFASVVPSTNSKIICKSEESTSPSTSLVNEYDETVDASGMIDGL
uniref:DNA repair protein XRCC4-like n=1 Tax=Styela clava TaxID=7725 RepID=UPI001939D11F|nr:DNA repair protein XRCC4-like [Styela clava]